MQLVAGRNVRVAVKPYQGFIGRMTCVSREVFYTPAYNRNIDFGDALRLYGAARQLHHEPLAGDGHGKNAKNAGDGLTFRLQVDHQADLSPFQTSRQPGAFGLANHDRDQMQVVQV
ncbi:hypothetical protein Purlil1_3266 [Purpureocillium lilacinum]|uniref:Uncharacterized protein n=1 Tax=Purpureocillium lilacinum TaxID=33203 RepID=A0ABR0C8Y3_PURLI|nr:hypothetical protein Purlil1_3266 [Purpureocillium lilacinum]